MGLDLGQGVFHIRKLTLDREGNRRFGCRGSITLNAVRPVGLRKRAHASQSPPRWCFQSHNADPDAPRASSAFQNEAFMGIICEVACLQPGLNGVIEVDPGHLVTQRIKNDWRQAAAIGDFEVDLGFEQDRGVQ